MSIDMQNFIGCKHFDTHHPNPSPPKCTTRAPQSVKVPKASNIKVSKVARHITIIINNPPLSSYYKTRLNLGGYLEDQSYESQPSLNKPPIMCDCMRTL